MIDSGRKKSLKREPGKGNGARRGGSGEPGPSPAAPAPCRPCTDDGPGAMPVQNNVWYRILADSTYDWEFLRCPDGRLLYSSPSCERITGYTPGEFLADPDLLHKIILPGDRLTFLEHHESASSAYDHGDMEFRIVTKGGAIRWIHHLCHPMFDEAGQYIGNRSSNRDITERRAAEAALRESEGKLNSIFRSAPTGIGVVVNRVFKEANEKLCEMTGYARGELLERDALFLYPTAEEYERVGRVKYGMIAERGAGQVETRWRRKDGAIIDILLSSSPIVPGDLSFGVTFTVLDITQRKRAEEELARLAAIVTSSDDAIISKTLDGTISSWNRGAEHLYGYTAGEAVGRPIGIIVPPERAREVQGILEGIRRGERIERFETERLTRDGRKIDVSITISPIYDAAGRVVGASTIGRDITEGKRAEAALRKSQHILAKSQEIAHVGNWAWNVQTGEASWSDESYRIFGFRPQEPGLDLGQFAARVHPGDRKIVDAFLDGARREGQRSSIDYRIVLPDGSVRYVNSVLDKVVRDRAGRAKWAYGIHQDITGRKKAEETLRKSQYILAKSQEMARVGNWAWNVQTGELNGSRETYRIYGYEPGEVLQNEDWVLSRVHPGDRRAFLDFLERVRRDGTRANIDYRIFMPDEATRYVNTLADKVVRDRDGRVKWVYGITQDITGRKRAEKALEEAKARAELYLDLMGHDINNMHQVALGFLEMALDRPGLDADLRDMLARSFGAIGSSSRIIENVRKLQKASSGEARRQVVDVGAVLAQVRAQYSGVPGSGATIRSRPGAACTVIADELLFDVFANVVGNAIEHSQPGVTIDIRVEPSVADGRECCEVTVEDDGPGVPDDLKPLIFDRLVRGNIRARGIGLGLYLVRTLVEGYGGRVRVEDRVPGDRSKGSRFVITLPLVGTMDTMGTGGTVDTENNR